MLIPIPDNQKPSELSEPSIEKKYFVDVVFLNGTRFSVPASDKANIPIKARETADLNNWRARCKKYSVVTVDTTVSIEEITMSDTNHGAKQSRLCKFGTSCRSERCTFDHPNGDKQSRLCKFGTNCRSERCTFDHPNGKTISMNGAKLGT
jgi:RNA-binding, Nab2-type zinc finger